MSDRRRKDLYHGPSLWQWLEGEGLLDRISEAEHPNTRRRLRDYRDGVNPTEASVDAICCLVDRMLDEVPAWVALGWPPAATEGLEFRWDSEGKRRHLVRA